MRKYAETEKSQKLNSIMILADNLLEKKHVIQAIKKTIRR